MKTWKDIIHKLLENPLLSENFKKVSQDRKYNKVYPEASDIFRAFTLCPIETLKVVIVGQDPYPQKSAADGLAFSTKQKETPESLNVIFKEIKRTSPTCKFENNKLDWWAKQGVLLLNTSLSVVEGKPNSHSALWKLFTLAIIKSINNSEKRVVWMLWGNHAKDYKYVLNNPDQCKLEACHPAAEFYGSDTFVGCNNFKDANRFLEVTKQGMIDWSIYDKEEPYPINWNN